ncbi:hypothetical protein CO675_04345 [Bradyrhizobium sp. C9]|nr:hypothetical protein CO675_04345 [Bradyrhizobium sp. C9]
MKGSGPDPSSAKKKSKPSHSRPPHSAAFLFCSDVASVSALEAELPQRRQPAGRDRDRAHHAAVRRPVSPTAALAFQSTGASFTVKGVPLARNAALVEGGLDLRITAQASFGIPYVGQLADRVQDHSVKGNFSRKF